MSDKDYKPKVITPTLGRKVIVVEDQHFKETLKKDRERLKAILDNHRKKK